MSLLLDEATRRALVTEARVARPQRCRGLLLGQGRMLRTVMRLWPAPNDTESPNGSFEIPETTLRDAERYAHTVGLEVIGLYHAHPEGPAVPSDHDRAQTRPGWSLIVIDLTGGAGPELRAWRLVPGSQEMQEEDVLEP